MTLAELAKRLLRLYYGTAGRANGDGPGTRVRFVIINISSYLFRLRRTESKRLKRALLSVVAAVALLCLTACGGSGNSTSNSSQNTTSGLAKRAFVTDRYNGLIYIIDAATDQYKGHTISSGAGASTIRVFPDLLHVIVVASGVNYIVSLDTKTEAVASSFIMPEAVTDVALASDNKTLYAAVRNAPVLAQASGAVEVVDITSTTSAPTANINVPGVRRIVLSHNGNKLLAFSDNSNQVAIIDTASKAVTFVGGFDRAVYGVFNSDDSTAYIMSCGKECGGTAAKVNTLNMSTNVVGPDVPVDGATWGLLDSSNLYVAGNNNNVGKLTVITTNTMTVSKSGVGIANGYHSVMALTNNHLFVGSTGCDNIATGCLSIYNTSSGAVTNTAPGSGDATGVQPISGRTVVYYVQGGELVLYDTGTDAPLPANKQIDIVGQAWDVRQVDQ
jgi:hypothetical protein